MEFQSRNRESFLFKQVWWVAKIGVWLGFNLVIENLFFSSVPRVHVCLAYPCGFQSRNRESFLFKV